MNLIYNIGVFFYKIAIFIVSQFNEKAMKLRHGQKNALDSITKMIQPNAEYVWFHAASLGEFEQGRPVIELLKKDSPSIKIILTFFSPSGYEVRKNYDGADIVTYLPLDTAVNAKRFIDLVKPSKAIFVKYEFWPNFLLQLKANDIPTYSISAIFRPNQVFFQWYGSWYRGLLNTFKHIFVQDSASLDLLHANGIKNVSVAGDTRFDRVYDLFLQSKQLPIIEAFVKGSSKIIVAGSTWAKDEELLVQYFKSHSNIKLILVPHEIHESHIIEITNSLNDNFMLYSKATPENVTSANCLVVDVIGILSSIYRYADVAYIGGGFGVGIHNTLEAAVFGVPVVFGPNYHKFREARELIAIGGAFSISNYDVFEAQIDALLIDNTPGSKAGEYVKQNTGATELILKEIVK